MFTKTTTLLASAAVRFLKSELTTCRFATNVVGLPLAASFSAELTMMLAQSVEFVRNSDDTR